MVLDNYDPGKTKNDSIHTELFDLSDSEENDSCLESCPHIIVRKIVELDISGVNAPLASIQELVTKKNLTHLYLTKNKLKEVPKAVMELQHIIKLDLSNNDIKYFNDIPQFLHKVQELSLANNALRAPPLWVWKESPRKLKCLNLSENTKLVCYLTEQQKYEYLQCYFRIFRLILFNSRLHKFIDLLDSIVDVEELAIGGGVMGDYNKVRSSKLYEFPLHNIMECYNTRKLQLRNTSIYDINKSIVYYTKLIYLDLSVNYIVKIPEEIGQLTKLEVLILNFNKVKVLPDCILNMKQLRILILTNNKIEYVPENLCSLPELQCLDLYDNRLSEIPKGYEHLQQVDFARNFANEPDTDEYLEKRFILRLHHPVSYEKVNERKIPSPLPDYDSDDYFELFNYEDISDDSDNEEDDQDEDWE